MENFQLYKTNLLLSGQVKWDVILEHSNNGLYVSDFNLSPISNNISYIRRKDYSMLRNKHQDNMKAYYKSIEGNFYDDGLDSIFNSDYPTISKVGEVPLLYSNIYDMGCKRSKSYKTYKKQFEFFCPIWLEKIDSNIEFEFNIKTPNNDFIIASKKLSLTSLKNIESHDLFVNYFSNYLDDSSIKQGNDNVINIQFTENKANLYGLNAKTGLFVTKDVSYIIENLTSRERPLMEFDNMITTLFSNNFIVCNQLINFNFCFDLNDIVSESIANMLYGENITISVDTYVDGRKLKLMDINTNYDTIHKDKYYVENATEDYQINVLDYLNDNKCIDFINKNKYCQKICHWSLCDNAEYIFNLYNGFSGYCIINNDIIDNLHEYGRMPNTIIKKHDYRLNNAGWLNVIKCNNYEDLKEYFINEDKKSDATFIYDKLYINNIKYKEIPKSEHIPNGLYLLGLQVPYNVMMSFVESLYNKFKFDINNNCWAVSIHDNLLMFISPSMDAFTFANIYDILKKYVNETPTDANLSIELNEQLLYLYKLMQFKEDPKLIMFNGLVDWEYAKGPSLETTEIEYYKNNNEHDYVFRYDGKIKPSFTTENQFVYYKDFISDDRSNGISNLQKSVYSKFINTNFIPIYPSIGYCPIRKTPIDYTIVPQVNTTECNYTISLLNKYEYSWFNNGVSIFISPELKFDYINYKKGDGTYESLNLIVHKLIKSHYNIKDNEIVKYIVDKYDVVNEWEYLSIDNIDDYKYTIRLTLK